MEFVESFVANPDITFKILIVGNPYVGKSCFLMRLCTNSFGTRYASTIGEKNDPRMNEGGACNVIVHDKEREREKGDKEEIYAL